MKFGGGVISVSTIALPVGTPHAKVTLQNGEELQLERSGDLGEGNGGMLIFVEGSQRPEYVRWTDVEQLDFHRPSLMYAPPSGREALEVNGKPFKAKGMVAK